MDLATITIADFKTQFFRDFPYLNPAGIADQPSQLSSDRAIDFVLDQDVTNAFAEAKVVFNQGLFGDDASIRLAYLYVTAHYLVNDLRAANQGLQGAGQFPVASRSVGSVSESYSIPQRYLDDPLIAFYTNTSYGMKFLSMALPALVGNMATVYGGTNP